MIKSVIALAAPLAALAIVVAGCVGLRTDRRRDASSSVFSDRNRNGKDDVSGDDREGNGKLWTALWPEGKVLAGEQDVRTDGSIEIKFPWWAAGVEGSLTIAGRRLDGPAPPVRAQINSGWTENGFSGDAFWSSGIIFATEGCWQVTGTLGAARLTFVTLVVRDPT